eukprot:6197018-Pleurochrysis_carterae.AAC.1
MTAGGLKPWLLAAAATTAHGFSGNMNGKYSVSSRVEQVYAYSACCLPQTLALARLFRMCPSTTTTLPKATNALMFGRPRSPQRTAKTFGRRKAYFPYQTTSSDASPTRRSRSRGTSRTR